MVLSRLGSLIPPIYPCYVIRFDSKFDLAGSWLNGSSWHLQLKYMIRNCNSIMSETPILFADLSFGVQILFGCLTWHMPLSVRSTIWEDLLERFFTPRNNAEVVETERRWDRADLFGCIRSKSWEIIELMDDQGVCVLHVPKKWPDEVGRRKLKANVLALLDAYDLEVLPGLDVDHEYRPWIHGDCVRSYGHFCDVMKSHACRLKMKFALTRGMWSLSNINAVLHTVHSPILACLCLGAMLLCRKSANFVGTLISDDPKDPCSAADDFPLLWSSIWM